MLLENKHAIIYGAGGSVGGTTARIFAREGATVFLAGRTLSTLDAVAHDITSAGGRAYSAVVDAFDKASVEQHFAEVVRQAGSVDISFNCIGLGDAQGQLFVDMSLERLLSPIDNAMRGQFLTSTTAARQMIQQKSGVILALTADVARRPVPYTAGFGVACAAMEGYFRQLAAEVGSHGVRVVCLRSAGSPDTPGVKAAFQLRADEAGISLEEALAEGSSGTMLKRLPLLAEVANAAALLASDQASAVTAAVANLTCGLLAD